MFRKMIKKVILDLKLTCEMKIPGSRAPNGTHEWSVPPIIENPSGP